VNATVPGQASEGSGATVHLRRARPADAELILAWRTEPSARRYQPLRPVTLDQLRQILGERAARAIGPALTGEVQWLLVAPGGPVGWFTLTVESREHGLGSVGYTIGERYRGRGYASAGLRALVSTAFSPRGADLWRLEAVAAVENAASCRVLERAGFVREGIARAYLLIDGVRVDHARYALLRDEWQRGEGERRDGGIGYPASPIGRR
jgi:ribosomal-protein-alanine N-acetyltransferase